MWDNRWLVNYHDSKHDNHNVRTLVEKLNETISLLFTLRLSFAHRFNNFDFNIFIFFNVFPKVMLQITSVKHIC